MRLLQINLVSVITSRLELKSYRKIFLALITIIMATQTYSQGNQWAWMYTVNSYGIYGDKGVAATTNKPGSRVNACFWQDNQGYFWLFGGGGLAQSTEGSLNDLWKFNPQTNEWTWVAGDSIINVSGNYGTMGVPAATNIIGCRWDGIGWSDPSGNIWIFGGDVPEPGIVGDRNDLWKFDQGTGYWTWMHGEKVNGSEGTYGTQGVPSPFNDPKSRALSKGWADDAGNLYLFGGASGYNGTTPFTLMNDLWKYSTATNQWIWLKGLPTAAPGVYGTRGIALPGNTPGSRVWASVCKGPDGKFWLMSGRGWDAQFQNSDLSDLWKYDPGANEWTWVSGDSLINQPPVYGSLGVANPANKPGSRTESAAWMDHSGNFWVYGGDGLADLWKYTRGTDEWTWVKGDSSNAISYPVYGTQGIPAGANQPGGQNICYYWSDASDNFWLAGNPPNPTDLWDLEFWKYTPDYSTTPVSLISFTGVYKNNIANLSWKVENESDLDRYEIERTGNARDYKKIGSVYASALNSYDYADELSNTTTDKFFYRLRMLDKDGSYSYSNVVIINIPCSGNILVTPNPSSEHVKVEVDKCIKGNIEIEVLDVAGRLIKKQYYNLHNQFVDLPVSDLPAGDYFLRLVSNGSVYVKKVAIQR